MNNLSNYLSHGYTNRMSKYLSKVLPDRYILSLFLRNNANQKIKNNPNVVANTIPELKSSNELTNELKSICDYCKFENAITLAVFGSIASNEIIDYSDFDGILIYDENKFNSWDKIISLKKLIDEINLFTHLQDCLQHHNIIVIGKNELTYNSDEIINQLIIESKLIYGANQIELSNTIKNNYSNSLIKLINSIQIKINQEAKWSNQYFFKNMISELLLLPCSYLQFTNQRYIAKKDSFEILKNHISSTELNLINQLENIRKNWIQQSIKKSELSKKLVNKIKSDSKTQVDSIEILSEIKEDLQLLLTRLKPND